jgi:enamine deaminase RidA (YjgF/YER057c/UK114 family)
VVGSVGKNLDVKAGREAAYAAALNVLALMKKQLGSLNRVSRVVRLGVYVAATPEFTEHPKIADAASELLRDVFGEQTVSSRLVFGVASLPLGSAVELEVILEVKH